MVGVEGLSAKKRDIEGSKECTAARDSKEQGATMSSQIEQNHDIGMDVVADARPAAETDVQGAPEPRAGRGKSAVAVVAALEPTCTVGERKSWADAKDGEFDQGRPGRAAPRLEARGEAAPPCCAPPP